MIFFPAMCVCSGQIILSASTSYVCWAMHVFISGSTFPKYNLISHAYTEGTNLCFVALTKIMVWLTVEFHSLHAL